MALLNVAKKIDPQWLVLFVCECDAKKLRPPKWDESYLVRRHSPPGSNSMAFVLRWNVQGAFQRVVWRGRCGACHILDESPGGLNLWCIGVHLPHDLDSLSVELSNLRRLVAQRLFGATIVFTGDWNVDQLPSHPRDP